jgi:alkylation response protein AidB-like acyl-CoA dehydrogenase
MDFDDNAEEAGFRREVRNWLRAHGPAKGSFQGLGDDAARLDAARTWQSAKNAAGYSCITWSTEYGGRGGTPIQQVIYNQEEAAYETPKGYFDVTLGMVVPTIIKVGDAATAQRFVGPALRGDQIWCQMFSEPGAGSDLAGLRTRAVKDGDDWLISGQKVWTSGAHYADFGLLLVRTDPERPKHKGLTMFWIDMRAPGVSVRPIKQMSGRANFNEVWFDEARVSDAQRLGPVNDGWRVALVTLMNERLSIGSVYGVGVGDAMAMARGVIGEAGRPVMQDRDFRAKVAEWYIAAEGVRLTGFRTLTALSRGATPGPESSISKVISANIAQDLAHQLLDIQGEFGIIADADTAIQAGSFQQALLGSPGGRLAGGTDEVLRNIIAERVLGLPGDIRLDKDVPFNTIPTGA